MPTVPYSCPSRFAWPPDAEFSCLSNSSAKLVSKFGPWWFFWFLSVRAPFCRKCFSRITALRVLHLYTASARSPINGTRPMTKSMITLIIIVDRRRDGSPPSMLLQDFTTIRASRVSNTSPALQNTLAAEQTLGFGSNFTMGSALSHCSNRIGFHIS